MEARRGSPGGAVTAVLAVFAVVLLCVLAVYAATVGPHDVLGDYPPTERSASTPTESPVTASASAEPAGSSGDTQRHTPSPWWGVVVLLIGLFALGLLVAASYWFLRWFLAELRNRRHPEELDRLVDLDPLRVDRLRERLAATAPDQRAALMAGPPRNAVVRCWAVFEDEVTALGWRREEWQTPAEFIVVVMETVGVDSRALVELADVYRRARFSSHPVTEADRARAVDALGRVHASLGAGAVS